MAEVGVIFLLLAAVAALATVANRISVPYPILLVVGGLALALVRLRNEGEISDEALRRIEHDLDLEETRLDS